MGCDIHAVIEYRSGSHAPWQRHLGLPNVLDDRDYGVFSVLAGVRNTDELPVIAEPRGVPDDFVESVTAPVYLVTGRHALAYLPEPAATVPMMLNTDDAIAICYRPGDEVDGSYHSTWDFLTALTDRYDTAGDPCCGYGRTGRVFLQAGKRAVLSDMNPLCIGYIAEHAYEWIAA